MPRTLAHQGGWDEVLLFVGPILLAFVLIRVLERRRRPAEPEEDDD